MALNWSVFKTRATTAVFFVAVMLLGLLWNQWSFLVLFTIIHFGCWWEWLRLAETIHRASFHIYTKLGFMLAGYGLMLWFCNPVIFQVNGFALKDNFSLPVSAAGFLLLFIGIFQSNPVNVKAFAMAVGGWIYISFAWGLMLDLAAISASLFQGIEPGMQLRPFDYSKVLIPIVIIVSVWVNDTMAYLVGSLIGKTPLTPVSPKKTWEGTIGGILLCIIVVGFLFSAIPGSTVVPGFHTRFNNSTWFFIAGIAAIAGTYGDLFKSVFKRKAGVKDSGTFLPGHGGFLDRFDSMLFATPAVWLYIQLFLK